MLLTHTTLCTHAALTASRLSAITPAVPGTSYSREHHWILLVSRTTTRVSWTRDCDEGVTRLPGLLWMHTLLCWKKQENCQTPGDVLLGQNVTRGICDRQRWSAHIWGPWIWARVVLQVMPAVGQNRADAVATAGLHLLLLVASHTRARMDARTHTHTINLPPVSTHTVDF